MPNFQITTIKNPASKQALQKTLTFMHSKSNAQLDLDKDATGFINRLSATEQLRLATFLTNMYEEFMATTEYSSVLSENEKIVLCEAIQRDPKHFDNIITRNDKNIRNLLTLLFAAIFYIPKIYSCFNVNPLLQDDICETPNNSKEFFSKIFWYGIVTPMLVLGFSNFVADTIREYFGCDPHLFSPQPITENAVAFDLWVKHLAKVIAEIENGKHKNNPRLMDLEAQTTLPIKIAYKAS